MEQELHMAPSGLFTDPLSRKALPGALRTADNIVIRRDGIAEPRPGFNYSKAMQGSNATYRAIPYKGNMVCYTAEPQVRWYSNLSRIYKEASADLGAAVLAENFRGCQVRNNLYIPFSDGVRKLTGALDAEAAKAGAPMPGEFFLHSEPAGDAVANTKLVRYRFLLKRIDASGLVVRGTPSNSLIYDNNSGANRSPTLFYNMSGEEKADDILELYRSTNFDAGTTPDEELFLVNQRTINATNIITGYLYVEDTNAATDLGATLYTAPSQEGALQENNRPPQCTDIALFKNSVFYANTELRQCIPLEMKEAADGDQSGDTTGIGRRLATADTTTGSNQLTNISVVAGLVSGQQISGVGIPSNTYIATISGTTATMTNNATATAAGISVEFFDTVFLGTPTAYTVYKMSRGIAAHLVQPINISGGNYIARLYSDSYDTAFTGKKAYLAIFSRVLGSSLSYVWGTHGEAYFPALTGPTGYAGGLFTGITTANGIASDSEDHANRIMWSKSDQPEHVPEVNYSPVGSENHDILRIIPTRDALFIFKKDGIWRLTGAGVESGWRIDEFDLSTKLLRPDCAVEMDNAIFAWTNKGLVRITDAGIDLISATAIGATLRNIELALLASSVDNVWPWIISNPKDNEIILAARSGASITVYVFNVKTLAWYTWTFYCASYVEYIVYNDYNHLLYILADNSTDYTAEAWIERRDNWITDASDREYTINISSVSDKNITITAGSGWTPMRGDSIIYSASAQDYMITTVTDATHVTVARSGLVTGAAKAYKSITCNIEWIVKTGQNEGTLKHYAEGGFTFNAFNGIYEVIYSFWSSLSSIAVEYYEAFIMLYAQFRDPTPRPRTVRFIVPTAHARVVYLYPKIRFAQALARFELSGLSLYYITLKGRGLARGDAVPGAGVGE